MRYALFSLLIMSSLSVTMAQDIVMYKTFGGVRFEYDSMVISPRQVQSILIDDAVAYGKFRKARTNSAVSALLGFTGGVLVGIPVGTAILGGDPEWGLALGGAALIGVSIPFNRGFQRNAQGALDIHNQKKSSRRNYYPEFYWSGTQLGLRMRL